jgi:hypothetical protein
VPVRVCVVLFLGREREGRFTSAPFFDSNLACN